MRGLVLSLPVLTLLAGAVWSQPPGDPDARPTGVALGMTVLPAPGGSAGLAVDMISPAGPAARAHVRPSDVIFRAGEYPMRDYDSLVRVLAAHRPGEPLPLFVLRDGEPRQVWVVPGQAPRREALGQPSLLREPDARLGSTSSWDKVGPRVLMAIQRGEPWQPTNLRGGDFRDAAAPAAGRPDRDDDRVDGRLAPRLRQGLQRFTELEQRINRLEQQARRHAGEPAGTPAAPPRAATAVPLLEERVRVLERRVRDLEERARRPAPSGAAPATTGGQGREPAQPPR